MEKDKEKTKRKLLGAVGSIMNEKGFSGLKVNEVAKTAGVSKMLIYRYFDNLDGLIKEFIKESDFWINYEIQSDNIEDLRKEIKNMYRLQAEYLSNNVVLQNLHLWELDKKSAFSKEISNAREENGLSLVQRVHEITGRSFEEVAVLSAILNGSVVYFSLFERINLPYNTLNFEKEGWEKILAGVEQIIDLWFEKM
jgi:AcrR family transcriptional regulator